MLPSENIAVEDGLRDAGTLLLLFPYGVSPAHSLWTSSRAGAASARLSEGKPSVPEKPSQRGGRLCRDKEVLGSHRGRCKA